jgi:hypothetical protein
MIKKILSPCIFLFPISLWCGNTTVLFQPSSPSVGPFPNNALTTSNSAQNTGLQIALPLPQGCTILSTSAECANINLINQLDGFSVNPTIRVCFSAPIDPNTVGSGVTLSPLNQSATVIGIDQILFDPASNCVTAKPQHVLDQQTQYLLSVSSNINDSGGKAVKSDDDFSNCTKRGASSYCIALSTAISQVYNKNLVNKNQLVSASLFTTLSATDWLQAARAQINNSILPSLALPAGLVSTFHLSNVQAITWKPQTGVAGVNYDQTIPLNVLTGVDQIAFGLFLSPQYLQATGAQAGTIPTTPTARPINLPNGINPVSFHVFVPAASSAPAGGFPVIIYGHGLGDNQFGAPTFAASTWAQKGFATIAIEITGHGYGPLSTTEVVTNTGTFTELTPGRGIQFSPAAPIGPEDGCILTNAIGTRDCSRQTAVDLYSLVRTIRNTNGLGLNLNPARIYYVGQSFGAFYGTLFLATEPNLSSGVLNGAGGSQIDAARLSPIARQIGAAYLATFTPPLNNVPPAPSQDYFHDSFNDEYVYPEQVVTDSVPGALAIQNAFDQADWLAMLGDPLSFTQHLNSTPLSGVGAKHVLVQFGLGDLEVPNPTESALVRNGSLQSATWMLRTDLAAAIDPTVLGIMQPGVPYPIYPHRFLSNPTIFNPASPALETAIAVAAQKQIADFFASGGTMVPNPNSYLTGAYAGQILFQIPPTLPESLNFFQIPR